VRNLEQNQSLRFWFEALANSVRSDEPDLSARQMAIMLRVYLTDGPHTVRGLTADLVISKPAVTRALDRLADLEFIARAKDPLDRRSVLINRTEAGEQFLNRFADIIASAKSKTELG
jgi:DNA-binding MarR family transcriptional regulator